MDFLLTTSSLNTFFLFDDILLLHWDDGGYFSEVYVVGTWSCCGLVDMVVRQRRVTCPPLPDDAVAVDFFSPPFKILFLLVDGKVEVPPLRVDLGIKDLLEVLVDLLVFGEEIGLVVDVVISLAILDLQDIGIVCWSLLLFDAVSSGVSC